ncbi:MAG: sulfite exporter TauE/SafE family protein [Mycobacterium sp.]
MTALTVVLAVLVGISLGLLGGGGSILMVPLLAYVAGMEPRHAIAMSLLVVGVTSAVGAITHARAGRVQWRIATYFGVAAMAGAYGGGRLAGFIPGTVLMVGFAVIMVAAAIAMLRGRKGIGGPEADHGLPVLKIVALGLGVGAFSGLVGAGGGFLLVPALAILGGLPMPAAVGTSLVIIAMQSFAGLAGHLTTEHLDWQLAAMVTGAAVVGAIVGGRLICRVDPNALRRLFGWFVLLMASVILAEETTLTIGAAAAGLTLVAAGVYLACTRTTHCPMRRLVARRHVGMAPT